MQLELLDLQCPPAWKTIHCESQLHNLYKNLDKNKYENLVDHALKLSSLFGSTYVCKHIVAHMREHVLRQILFQVSCGIEAAMEDISNVLVSLVLLYQAKNLATKAEILRALKDGVSRQQVMESYDVKRSTWATYVKIEVEILQAFESEKFNAKRKRLWKVVYPKVEEALLR
ncbi:hypothetical protein HPB47_001813 [Ixodes persulcatus]|uniref:Uncharacterized protein n=1 Tax=Ixodes persulcatus TaxID=34615 RepID=A0AC60PNT7_IXOPE|nr:hypothetical protein HPB47_001813 [Ixodes persulcatus]